MTDPVESLPVTLSVVLPNFNHAAYLQRSLGSLADQTRQADEVIIIDDASSDESVEIIEHFAATRPSWQCIRESERGGVVRRLNDGLARATGEWVLFFGSDDGLMPHAFERALALARQWPQAGVISGCAAIVDRFGRSRLRPRLLPTAKPEFITPQNVSNLLRSSDNFFHGTVTLYRRSALAELGGFDPDLGYMCDGIVTRRLVVRHGLGFIPEVLGYWSLRNDNYSVNIANDRDGFERIVNHATCILNREPDGLFPASYAEEFERRIRFVCACMVMLNRDMSDAQRRSTTLRLISNAEPDPLVLRVLLALGAFGRAPALAWMAMRQLSWRLILRAAFEPIRRVMVRAPDTAAARFAALEGLAGNRGDL